jgi:hypothetical protein
VGVDLVEPPEIPENCTFVRANILTTPFVESLTGHLPDFIVASSPCEEFSVHGMKHFHPNPKYPEIGIKLFNHTRKLCEVAGVPYVMENVRSAQKFVGNAVSHCGPFYLWGTGVPPLLNQGIKKGIDMGGSQVVKGLSRAEITVYRKQFDMMWSGSKSEARKQATAKAATIPPELANCVADYAERLLEQGIERQRAQKNPQ